MTSLNRSRRSIGAKRPRTAPLAVSPSQRDLRVARLVNLTFLNLGQRITVALICDGLGNMDKSVLDILATIGVYQDGIMKSKVDENDTVAHIFEVNRMVYRIGHNLTPAS